MAVIHRREFSKSRYWANRAHTALTLAAKMPEDLGRRRLLGIAADYQARAEHFRQLEHQASALPCSQR